MKPDRRIAYSADEELARCGTCPSSFCVAHKPEQDRYRRIGSAATGIGSGTGAAGALPEDACSGLFVPHNPTEAGRKRRLDGDGADACTHANGNGSAEGCPGDGSLLNRPKRAKLAPASPARPAASGESVVAALPGLSLASPAVGSSVSAAAAAAISQSASASTPAASSATGGFRCPNCIVSSAKLQFARELERLVVSTAHERLAHCAAAFRAVPDEPGALFLAVAAGHSAGSLEAAAWAALPDGAVRDRAQRQAERRIARVRSAMAQWQAEQEQSAKAAPAEAPEAAEAAEATVAGSEVAAPDQAAPDSPAADSAAVKPEDKSEDKPEDRAEDKAETTGASSSTSSAAISSVSTAGSSVAGNAAAAAKAKRRMSGLVFKLAPPRKALAHLIKAGDAVCATAVVQAGSELAGLPAFPLCLGDLLANIRACKYASVAAFQADVLAMGEAIARMTGASVVGMANAAAYPYPGSANDGMLAQMQRTAAGKAAPVPPVSFPAPVAAASSSASWPPEKDELVPGLSESAFNTFEVVADSGLVSGAFPSPAALYAEAGKTLVTALHKAPTNKRYKDRLQALESMLLMVPQPSALSRKQPLVPKIPSAIPPYLALALASPMPVHSSSTNEAVPAASEALPSACADGAASDAPPSPAVGALQPTKDRELDAEAQMQLDAALAGLLDSTGLTEKAALANVHQARLGCLHPEISWTHRPYQLGARRPFAAWFDLLRSTPAAPKPGSRELLGEALQRAVAGKRRAILPGLATVPDRLTLHESLAAAALRSALDAAAQSQSSSDEGADGAPSAATSRIDAALAAGLAGEDAAVFELALAASSGGRPLSRRLDSVFRGLPVPERAGDRSRDRKQLEVLDDRMPRWVRAMTRPPMEGVPPGHDAYSSEGSADEESRPTGDPMSRAYLDDVHEIACELVAVRKQKLAAAKAAAAAARFDRDRERREAATARDAAASSISVAGLSKPGRSLGLPPAVSVAPGASRGSSSGVAAGSSGGVTPVHRLDADDALLLPSSPPPPNPWFQLLARVQGQGRTKGDGVTASARFPDMVDSLADKVKASLKQKPQGSAAAAVGSVDSNMLLELLVAQQAQLFQQQAALDSLQASVGSLTSALQSGALRRLGGGGRGPKPVWGPSGAPLNMPSPPVAGDASPLAPPDRADGRYSSFAALDDDAGSGTDECKASRETSLRALLVTMGRKEREAVGLLAEFAPMDVDRGLSHLRDFLPPSEPEVLGLLDTLGGSLRKALVANAELRSAWMASRRGMMTLPAPYGVEARLRVFATDPSDGDGSGTGNSSGNGAVSEEWDRVEEAAAAARSPTGSLPASASLASEGEGAGAMGQLAAAMEEELEPETGGGFITIGDGRVALELQAANLQLRARLRDLELQLAGSS
jgi:hypothetical protein